jgi:peptidyl serine alpha-galactosyltransferase
MYGYVFAAAKHNMWHKIDHTSMIYPDYTPSTPPRLLHYGLTHKVATTTGNFAFDKHWHIDFDAMQCPPWGALDKDSKGGLFQHPPSPRTLLPDAV